VGGPCWLCRYSEVGGALHTQAAGGNGAEV